MVGCAVIGGGAGIAFSGGTLGIAAGCYVAVGSVIGGGAGYFGGSKLDEQAEEEERQQREKEERDKELLLQMRLAEE